MGGDRMSALVDRKGLLALLEEARRVLRMEAAAVNALAAGLEAVHTTPYRRTRGTAGRA